MTSAKILDPICDMVVDLAEAREQGLSVELAEREYGFCSASCMTKFAKDPAVHVPKVEAWLATGGGHAHAARADAHLSTASAEMPAIDAGMRAWYSSCRCCLSDAHPQVVEILDRERATAQQAPAEAGICETAEATDTQTT
jgi:YHS domain-containing protein